jgi:hypothetical protein
MCTKMTTSNDLEISTGTRNHAITGSDVSESCCEVNRQKVTNDNKVAAGNGVITRMNVTKQNDSW